LTQKAIGGITRSFGGPAGKPVELWIGDGVRTRDVTDLIVHFHGAAWLPEQAVASLGKNYTAAVLNLGTGSGAYDRAFSDPTVFASLLAAVTREVSSASGRPTRIGRITLVGFSAGHGSVRDIIPEQPPFPR